MHKTLIMAQGLADAVGEGKSSNVQQHWKNYTGAVFPWTKGAEAVKDSQMKEVMAKEVAKGAITFSAIRYNPLKEKAQRMNLDSNFKKRMNDAREQRLARMRKDA